MNHKARITVSVLFVFGLGVLSQPACKKENPPAPTTQNSTVDAEEMERHQQAWLKLFLEAQDLIDTGDLEQCVQADRKTLDFAEKNFPPDSENIALSLSRLASSEASTGNYAEAEKLHLRAHPIFSANFGPEDPFTVTNLESIGKVYMSQGKYKDAAESLNRAVKIQEKNGPVLKPLDPPFEKLAHCYTVLKQYPEQEDAYRRWIAYLENKYSPEHPEVLRVQKRLGKLYLEQAKFDEAEKLYLHMLDVAEKTYGQNHNTTKTIRGLLGILYTNKGDLESARQIQHEPEKGDTTARKGGHY